MEIKVTKNNTKDRGSMDSAVELKKTVIHQQQILGKPPSKIYGERYDDEQRS